MQGLAVSGVVPDSLAKTLEIQAGDILLQVAEKDIRAPKPKAAEAKQQ